jgi:hypothetical protein
MPDVADSREAIALKNTGVFVDATPEGEKGVDYVTALAGTLIEKRAETRKALRIWAWHSRLACHRIASPQPESNIDHAVRTFWRSG